MSTNCRRFVGLGEDPQVLAIRAPELFAVSEMSRSPFVADDLGTVDDCFHLSPGYARCMKGVKQAFTLCF